jgi:hypothetical protein
MGRSPVARIVRVGGRESVLALVAPGDAPAGERRKARPAVIIMQVGARSGNLFRIVLKSVTFPYHFKHIVV